jgi:hypothetical protein
MEVGGWVSVTMRDMDVGPGLFPGLSFGRESFFFFFEIREIEREKKLIEGVDYGEPVACFTD